MPEDFTVQDANGKEIEVGTKIKDDDDPGHPGEVYEITDPDGDVDDEGRSIAINPKVKVRYHNGDEDGWLTYWSAKGPWDEDAPYICDDVEVAE